MPAISSLLAELLLKACNVLLADPPIFNADALDDVSTASVLVTAASRPLPLIFAADVLVSASKVLLLPPAISNLLADGLVKAASVLLALPPMLSADALLEVSAASVLLADPLISSAAAELLVNAANVLLAAPLISSVLALVLVSDSSVLPSAPSIPALLIVAFELVVTDSSVLLSVAVISPGETGSNH